MTSFLGLFLATTWFAAGTFAHFEQLHGWEWVGLPMLITGSFVPSTMLSHRFHNSVLGAANVISGIAMGLLNYFLLAALGCWVAFGIERLAGTQWNMRMVAAAAFGAAAMAGLVGLFSAYWLRVTRLTVELPNLPPFWNGRSLALVSDLHLGNFRGARFARHVVSRIMALEPECILIGGDMFDGVKMEVPHAVQPLKALSAPSGVYFVGGNHDDYGGRKMYFAALRQVGMTILNNEKVELHGLQLLGVHDAETHQPEVFRKILNQAAVDPLRTSVLLAHRPSNLSVPEEAGINLQLSGHTHRGQFWPWTILVKRIHGPYAYGLNRFGRMWVFTSSGAGTWGPPFRLGSRSEIVLIRLKSA